MSHRKADHVKVVLGKDVEGRYRYWNDVQLVHRALPEIDFEEIDPSVTLLGHRLAAPIVITGMTGGFPDAAKINENLAQAAAEVGVAMGVGSERAAILKGQYPESYSCVARHAVPLKFANIGAPQIVPQKPGDRVVGPDDVRAAMELIHADVLAIHLNFLQEIVQPEGDRRAKGCLERIGELAARFPVLVKETGAGLSREVAEELRARSVKAFDVSGTGGTSFAAVEHYRAVEQGDERQARVGKTFWDWGIRPLSRSSSSFPSVFPSSRAEASARAWTSPELWLSGRPPRGRPVGCCGRRPPTTPRRARSSSSSFTNSRSPCS